MRLVIDSGSRLNDICVNRITIADEDYLRALDPLRWPMNGRFEVIDRILHDPGVRRAWRNTPLSRRPVTGVYTERGEELLRAYPVYDELSTTMIRLDSDPETGRGCYICKPVRSGHDSEPDDYRQKCALTNIRMPWPSVHPFSPDWKDLSAQTITMCHRANKVMDWSLRPASIHSTFSS